MLVCNFTLCCVLHSPYFADISVSGSLWFGAGSPSLAHLIRANALEVPHPTAPNKTLWDARNDMGPFTQGSADADFMATWNKKQDEQLRTTGGDELGVPPLGSGSDFTVFLQRLGVASMDGSFGNTPTDSVYHYHSIYDSVVGTSSSSNQSEY
jgi:N-acetylated-alpha-linked acidic dipeptidase